MEMDIMYFDSYFTKICSMGPVNYKSALAEINGLAMNKRQSITQPVII